MVVVAAVFGVAIAAQSVVGERASAVEGQGSAAGELWSLPRLQCPLPRLACS